MFRSAKWWTEKNRVKANFKLHFHITLFQVFQSGVDALALSIVPSDIGKPTTRLEKATVRDGICRWENPVYETVKFIQDPKTGKISDKIYHFSVLTGLSKASTIGEVSLNFADYVEATKPSSVSLPIKNSNCDAVLHVSIQRLQESIDQRDGCEDGKLKPNDGILRNHLSNGDTDEGTKSYCFEDVSAKAIINRAELSGNSSTSSRSDITLSTSDDSSGLDSPRENGIRKLNNRHNTYGLLSDISHMSEPQKAGADSSTSMYDVHQRSQGDWSEGLDHRETERLKAELAALTRQVNVSDLELQTLRKQIMKESKRGQELTKEVIILKEERDAFKLECENLRSFHKRMDEAKVRNISQLESGDLCAFVEEIRQELNYEKDLNANLRLQLKKMQESNAELVLAVQDLDEMLEQKNREICNHSNRFEKDKNSEELEVKLSSKGETDDDEEQKALEELVKEKECSNGKDTQLLEKEIIELYGEIEMYKRDKDELEMQMEQLALEYEILKQENHGIACKLEQSQLQDQLNMQYECSSPPAAKNDTERHIENLESQLMEQSEELSNSMATIKALQNHIRSLEETLEKQARGFEADLEAVTRDKVEQEQRRIRAEEALRKTRLINAKTAEKLQEEFGRLSMQMTSTFDANEKATMRALTEASELRSQKRLLEEMMHKLKEELQSVKADYEVKVDELSNQIETMTVQIQQMLFEIEDKSKELENEKKDGEQVCKDFSEKIQNLEAENEKLKVEISCLCEQVEGNGTLRSDLELMKKSVEESETLLLRGTEERNELVIAIVLLKKDAEQSLNELNRMLRLRDENEKEARNLHSELKAVRAQYNELKQSHSKDEAEKENLKKQVCQLQGELKKKDDALTNMEKRFKDSNGRTHTTGGTKTIPKNQKAASIPQNSKEMASLREKIKMLEGMIKTKETALETSTTTFSKKEKELQTKIEELENKLEEFNRNITLQKAVRSIDSSNDVSEEVRSAAVQSEENGTAQSLNSNENLVDKEAVTSIIDTADSKPSDILTELSLVKERNKSMESELKEMQERYLEMSLRFAEVEGERQQLVMTVRNLKSNQKG